MFRSGIFHQPFQFAAITGLFLMLFLGSHLLKADNILVGGTLTEDQVWTADNVYIVVQDLRIVDNISLVIEPGVVVKVNQGRGILVWSGNLIAGDDSGALTDSVVFRANYTVDGENWKWKGIAIQSISDENKVSLNYVSVREAEIALNLLECYQVMVSKTRLTNSQQLGFRMQDCRRCVLQESWIEGNYDGLEMMATTLGVCVNNFILNNRFSNVNHNLYLQNLDGGQLSGNIISGNIIEGGNNGIWTDNSNLGVTQDNQITNNVLVNNGSGFGYALLLSFQRSTVSNNIFWLNNSAITFDPLGRNNLVTNNQFYQNQRGIQLSAGSQGNNITGNTFSDQQISIYDTKEFYNVEFVRANIFPRTIDIPLVINSSSKDQSVSPIFWDTSDTTIIQQLIWDHHDDPSVGSLFYQPYWSEPDTLLPISPPFVVRKQWVDGQVRVSWDGSKEIDYRGNKVYYGEFSYYHFSNSVDVGNSRSYLLPGVAISDSIAVTAYDKDGLTGGAQVTGHESPFSFASYYPYAGENDQFCFQQGAYDLNQSSAPFLYDELRWVTTGDGQFSDPGAVHTSYIPGEKDYISGQVSLVLEVMRENQWRADSMWLFVYRTPEVWAGPDTTIFNDTTIYLDQAQVQYGSAVHWITSGDGSFSSDTLLQTVYYPGVNDIDLGSVKLILMADNLCSQASDSMTISFAARFLLRGAVWQGEYNAKGVAVLAYENTGGITRAASKVLSDEQGHFLFSDLFPGHYLLSAVPDTTESNGFYPGYYVNSDQWNYAYQLTLNADTYDVDIHLPELYGDLPAGIGTISGHFESMAGLSEIHCQSWFNEYYEKDLCLNGQSNVTILLYNSTRAAVLDYTLTDASGNFYFSELPMGAYVVEAELAGYICEPSPVLQITPQYPDISGIVLTNSQNKIYINIPDEGFGSNNQEISIYPNPAGAYINLVFAKDSIIIDHVNLSNLTGQQISVVTEADGAQHQGNTTRIILPEVKSGLYFGSVWTNRGRFHFKVFIH